MTLLEMQKKKLDIMDKLEKNLNELDNISFNPLISILEEAEKIVGGARNEDYGSVKDNFDKISTGWEEIFKDGIFNGRKVALAMIWLKICRDINTPKRDNLVDIAGYARCAEKYSNS